MMKDNIETLSECLDGNKILILGGTGLFAKDLLPELINYIDIKKIKTYIYIITRDKNRAIKSIPHLERKYIQIVTIDFLKESKFNSKIDPTYILHMANTTAEDTFLNVPQITKYLLLKNSVEAIGEIIKNGNVKRVIFTSSGVVYGDLEEFKEGSIGRINHLDVKSSLALGKMMSEYYLNTICKEFNTEFKIARCFTFISRFLPTHIHYAIGNFVQDAVQGKDIIIRGDGKDIRSYQNVSDAVDWISYLVHKKNAPDILNVGSDEAITIKELAEKIKILLNSSNKIIVKNENPPIDNQRRFKYLPCLDLAYEIGLNNRKTLEDGVNELADQLRLI